MTNKKIADIIKNQSYINHNNLGITIIIPKIMKDYDEFKKWLEKEKK